MMTHMKPKTGTEFLASIGKDKFRTFLRLCANYNTLNTFLATMKDSNKNELMREFVTGLDNTLEKIWKVLPMWPIPLVVSPIATWWKIL